MTYPTAVQTLFERIVNVCRGQDRSSEVIERGFGIGLQFRAQGGWLVVLIAHEAGLMVGSVLPLVVPPERVSALIDLVNRLNLMSLSGMLEVLVDERQLRLRHCVGASPRSISSRIIRDKLRYNSAMTRYAIPKLTEFLNGGMSAEATTDCWLQTRTKVSSTDHDRDRHWPHSPRFHFN